MLLTYTTYIHNYIRISISSDVDTTSSQLPWLDCASFKLSVYNHSPFTSTLDVYRQILLPSIYIRTSLFSFSVFSSSSALSSYNVKSVGIKKPCLYLTLHAISGLVCRSNRILFPIKWLCCPFCRYYIGQFYIDYFVAESDVCPHSSTLIHWFIQLFT